MQFSQEISGPGRAAIKSLQNAELYADTSFARRGLLEDADPTLSAASAAPWEVVIMPVNTSIFRTSRNYLATPNILLYQEHYAGAAHIAGAAPNGMLSTMVPLRESDSSRYFYQSARKSMLPATTPSCVDGYYGAGQEHLLIHIRLDFLEQNFSPEDFDALLTMARTHWLTTEPLATRELAVGLLALLHETRHNPHLLAAETSVHQLELDLVDALSGCLDRACHSPGRSSCSIRQKGFERAMDVLNQSPVDAHCQGIAELCRLSGVSQRTLEYAFRERTGHSPKRFLKVRRYHELRRRLLREDSKKTSVQNTAMELGLYELGRMAGEYRCLFNETPSQTLRHNRPPANTSMQRRSTNLSFCHKLESRQPGLVM